MQNEIEVMRVFRVPPLGALVVHAGNARYQQLVEVNNEQTKQRLLAAIGELVTFAGGYEALVDAGVAPALQSGESGAPTEREGDDESLRRRRDAFLTSLEVSRGVPADAFQIGATQEESLATTQLDEAAQPSSLQGRSLLSQIDIILQRHLAANPSLANRSVHLYQPLGQPLQIVVDGQAYAHPDDIEDEDVRRVLKAALKEWEAR